MHASDPDQPYVAYGEAVDGELQVVVYDVEADAEEARVTVRPTAETWFPVALDGDTVYVQDRARGRDLRGRLEGRHAPSPRTSRAPGRSPAATPRRRPTGRPTVVDVAQGDVLLTADGPGYFDLSPDGRYAQLVDEEGGGSTVRGLRRRHRRDGHPRGPPLRMGLDRRRGHVQGRREPRHHLRLGHRRVHGRVLHPARDPGPRADHGDHEQPGLPGRATTSPATTTRLFLGNCYEKPRRVRVAGDDVRRLP